MTQRLPKGPLNYLQLHTRTFISSALFDRNYVLGGLVSFFKSSNLLQKKIFEEPLNTFWLKTEQNRARMLLKSSPLTRVEHCSTRVDISMSPN